MEEIGQYSEICDLVRNRRAKVGISRKQLAQRTGVSYGTIKNIETGSKRTSLANILRILHELGVQLHYKVVGI